MELATDPPDWRIPGPTSSNRAWAASASTRCMPPGVSPCRVTTSGSTAATTSTSAFPKPTICGVRSVMSRSSIPVLLWLERAFGLHPDIGRLIGIQLGQLHADAVQMQARHLFIQVLGQDVDLVLVLAAVLPQLDLRQH